ncbi:hypothetical protein QYE76_007298 [Lolium multiflorum]|uniref:Syringolide-induced protein 14-1-1 n=1 Tax=Lolium multiflorum TaxID=4521 RepID=A0AAD8RWG2_LOLMU|nr:hypothetical protein QYE76_007298 [Lolium multiflorum]
MERKPSKHARSRSGAGAALASFLRSTAASFSSSTTNFTVRGKSSFNHRNAFSGPMVSIVPPEARGAAGRRRGAKNQGGGGSGYRTPEASSPKVSCIGQIKRSKSNKSRKNSRKAAKPAPPACGMDGGACPLPPRHPPATSRPKSSLVRRMLFRRSRSRSSSSSTTKPTCASTPDAFKGRRSSVAAAPAGGGLGQMKRFTSGRAALQDFDWTTDDEQAEPRGSDADGYDSYEDDGFVAHSAPLVLGGGVVASEPRKEVNLWRRRPMSPPKPLQLPSK